MNPWRHVLFICSRNHCEVPPREKKQVFSKWPGCRGPLRSPPRLNTWSEAAVQSKDAGGQGWVFRNIILSGIAKTRNALLLGKRP